MEVLERLLYVILPLTSFVGTLSIIERLDRFKAQVGQFKRMYWLVYWLVYYLAYLVFALSAIMTGFTVLGLAVLPGFLVGSYLKDLSNSWIVAIIGGIVSHGLWIIIAYPFVRFYQVMTNDDETEINDLKVG